MGKLVLLRHGETEWNKQHLFCGWQDVDLNATGITEVKLSGELIQAAGIDFDVAFASYLKRSIHSLNLVLALMDRVWIPVHKSYRLNERHYGALQGLNKDQMVKDVGHDQVYRWRRTYTGKPPELDRLDPRSPYLDRKYEGISVLPLSESLADTAQRILPYYHQEILPHVLAGESVLVSMHANSIRALIKGIESIDDESICDLYIPTGVPIVYDFDEQGHLMSKTLLGDEAMIKQRTSKLRMIASAE